MPFLLHKYFTLNHNPTSQTAQALAHAREQREFLENTAADLNRQLGQVFRNENKYLGRLVAASTGICLTGTAGCAIAWVKGAISCLGPIAFCNSATCVCAVSSGLGGLIAGLIPVGISRLIHCGTSPAEVIQSDLDSLSGEIFLTQKRMDKIRLRARGHLLSSAYWQGFRNDLNFIQELRFLESLNDPVLNQVFRFFSLSQSE